MPPARSLATVTPFGAESSSAGVVLTHCSTWTWTASSTAAGAGARGPSDSPPRALRTRRSRPSGGRYGCGYRGRRSSTSRRGRRPPQGGLGQLAAGTAAPHRWITAWGRHEDIVAAAMSGPPGTGPGSLRGALPHGDYVRLDRTAADLGDQIGQLRIGEPGRATPQIRSFVPHSAMRCVSRGSVARRALACCNQLIQMR